MLTLVNSQLQGTLNSTGTAFYTATLKNPYDQPINNLTVQIALAGLFCPITEEQISVSKITVTYPKSDNTVPPGEEVFISAILTTNKAPTNCLDAVPPTPFMLIAPKITVQFQFVGAPPTFNSSMTLFLITP
jgi:hypothetical protein